MRKWITAAILSITLAFSGALATAGSNYPEEVFNTPVLQSRYFACAIPGQTRKILMLREWYVLVEETDTYMSYKYVSYKRNDADGPYLVLEYNPEISDMPVKAWVFGVEISAELFEKLFLDKSPCDVYFERTGAEI